MATRTSPRAIRIPALSHGKPWWGLGGVAVVRRGGRSPFRLEPVIIRERRWLGVVDKSRRHRLGADLDLIGKVVRAGIGEVLLPVPKGSLWSHELLSAGLPVPRRVRGEWIWYRNAVRLVSFPGVVQPVGAGLGCQGSSSKTCRPVGPGWPGNPHDIRRGMLPGTHSPRPGFAWSSSSWVSSVAGRGGWLETRAPGVAGLLSLSWFLPIPRGSSATPRGSCHPRTWQGNSETVTYS